MSQMRHQTAPPRDTFETGASFLLTDYSPEVLRSFSQERGLLSYTDIFCYAMEIVCKDLFPPMKSPCRRPKRTLYPRLT